MHEIESMAIDSPYAPVAAQAHQYVATDGSSVDHPHAEHLILVYVRGRSSGVVRRVPLVSVADGDDLIIIASKGGAPEHPAWYLNLRADPRVWVRNKADVFEATAITLDGVERQEAFDAMVDVMPFFADYQAGTERVLPVVRLRRTG